MQRFQDPSQEFHLSRSPSDARPNSSCTALRASCAAVRKISPTATLRMMPDAPERQGNSEETQCSRLEREKTRSRQQKISRLSQTVQDIQSIGKDCIKYQSIKIIQTNPGSTTSGEELGPKGALDRLPRTRQQNKTSILPPSPSWK